MDLALEPVPTLKEDHPGPPAWSAVWLAPPFIPTADFVDQVYGICFDARGRILLVRTHDVDGVSPYWNLPGGGLEQAETFEECLAREVAEEGCARVLASAYLGCQRVDQLNATGDPCSTYQLRYWARVELDDWQPEHETVERRLVTSDEFRGNLTWGAAATAGLILTEGLRVETDYGRQCNMR